MMASKVVIENKLKVKSLSRNYRAAILTMLSRIADHLQGEAAHILESHSHANGTGHIYKGNLFDDLRSERFANGNEDKDQMGVACFVGGASKDYGEVIHNQRKVPAKAPPYAALSEWVAYKLGIPKDDPEHFIVVRTIQRNIARRGLKSIGRDGLQFFWGPLFENHKKYLEWIGKACRKVRA
ncbi:MAG: hypothetical protein AB1656_05095 [Candidatus Omnitrophota bacterium]